MATIGSPCRNICVLDPNSRLCLGCGRRMAEIERWAVLSEQERQWVVMQLPQRLAALRLPAQVRVEQA